MLGVYGPLVREPLLFLTVNCRQAVIFYHMMENYGTHRSSATSAALSLLREYPLQGVFVTQTRQFYCFSVFCSQSSPPARTKCPSTTCTGTR